MMIYGQVCVHFLKVEEGGHPQAVLTYTNAEGEEYYRSEPFDVTPGNKACFGEVCAECEMSAVFSYEPEHREQHQQAKGPQRPGTPQPAKPGQPQQPRKV